MPEDRTPDADELTATTPEAAPGRDAAAKEPLGTDDRAGNADDGTQGS